VNVTHEITSPQGGVFSSNSYSTIYVPGGTGTFTHCAINNANGCKSCKTFTVTSSQGFPTFSVVSAGNFTLGCNTKSLISVNIINGSAAGGGPVSYTLLPPTSDGSTPSGTLNSNSTYTVNTPGTYTVVTKDNTSFCETRTPISILQNTFTPVINVNVNSYILSCNEPTVLLVGSSTTPKVSYNWSFPPTNGPGNVPDYSLSVAANTLNTTATLVANYTLTVTDNNNTCKSTTVVPVLQNLFKPKTLMSAGSLSLSCKVPTVVLSNNSSTGIPPNTFPSPLPVIGYLWEGPTPQVDGQVRSTYVAATPGTYTLTGKDLNNGCTSTTVLTIQDDFNYPIVNNPDAPPQSILDCGANATKLYPIVTNSANTTYSWTAPPTASVTGANSATLSTNATGDYTVLVTNTVSGCAKIAYMIVQPGTITAKFDADTTGYAPLDLRISNKSTSSLGNIGITSVWSFGNGTYSSTAASDPPLSTRYAQPGTYTITLYVLKGECADTIQKVIRVESHSEIEIPNVFTPNGDGANDLFFVKAKNLTEISIIIYDRWGHMVYDLNSTTGNISWDGLNQTGQKVAEGIYYYVLTAKGSDGEEFKHHGNITLIR
jgi:gliding motility-associated-like protein